MLLHGEAGLCAVYLAAAGLGRLRVTGPAPALAGRDPAFRLEAGHPGDPAELVLDLGDGAAWRAAGDSPRLWGGTVESRILLGVEPRPAGGPAAVARALLEILAAGEGLWRLLGHEPHVYDFEL